MQITIKELYKRFNQFDEYYNSAPIIKSVTMAKIYRDYLGQNIDIEKVIYSFEKKIWKYEGEQLFWDSNAIQPKSTGFRLLLLRIILDSIPISCYKKMEIEKCEILGITHAIALYYLALHTDAFSDLKMDDKQKEILIQSEDFSFGLKEIQMVRDCTSDKMFSKYMEFFSEKINNIVDENACLFNDGESYFIFCIEVFVEYILLKIERIARGLFTKEEYDLYTKNKGELFEQVVTDIVSVLGEDVFHTIYYYPNSKQRMELDVVVRDEGRVAIFECKSGTFDVSNVDKDDAIKLQIKNKTKKAYRTLKAVSDYISYNGNYQFTCDGKCIEGKAEDSFLIHVFMYPMDFIASNIHALFDELYNEDNPILSISLEHLIAIILDAKYNGICLFDYWKRRKRFIQKYSRMFFDNNELDLYYNLEVNKNSLLNELERNGILNQLSHTCRLFSSFHNQYGEEVRAANMLLQQLDNKMLLRIILEGTRICQLSNSYLHNLEEYLRVK